MHWLHLYNISGLSNVTWQIPEHYSDRKSRVTTSAFRVRVSYAICLPTIVLLFTENILYSRRNGKRSRIMWKELREYQCSVKRFGKLQVPIFLNAFHWTTLQRKFLWKLFYAPLGFRRVKKFFTFQRICHSKSWFSLRLQFFVNLNLLNILIRFYFSELNWSVIQIYKWYTWHKQTPK
jgi:hypothetical protein